VQLDDATMGYGHIVSFQKGDDDEEGANIHIRGKGSMWVPRYHLHLVKPEGHGNKVVITSGTYKGSVGKVESTSKRLRGNWKIKRSTEGDMVLVPPSFLVVIL
jgi:hypothetical protein